MRTIMFSAMRWGWLGLVVLAAGGPSAGAATLRWKFKAGENLHYAMEQKTVTTVNLNGQEVKTTLTQMIDMIWSVKSVDDQGTADVTQTFDRLRTKIESAFGAFEYDSKAEKEPEGPIAAGTVPLLKALVGAQFSFKMSPQGELSDVRVPEGVAKALREAGAGAAGGAGAGPFSEEGLKSMIVQSSLALPKEDLTKGRTWTRTTKAPTPPIGTMVLDKTYSYEGPDEQAGGHVERIGLVTKVVLEPAADSKLALKIKSQEGKGSFDFDNDAGRVIRSHVTESMEMVMNISNTDVNQNIDTTTDMKLIPAGEAKSPQ
jgi:Family of unknown function (DUF6263)